MINDNSTIQNPIEPEPEPEPEPNPYESIISQQSQQIDALIRQNESLSRQITRLVEDGAQISQAPAQPVEPENPHDIKPLFEGDDLTLESLGKMIGKKNV